MAPNEVPAGSPVSLTIENKSRTELKPEMVSVIDKIFSHNTRESVGPSSPLSTLAHPPGLDINSTVIQPRLDAISQDLSLIPVNSNQSADPVLSFTDYQYDPVAYQRYISLVYPETPWGPVRGLVPGERGEDGGVSGGSGGDVRPVTGLATRVTGHARVSRQPDPVLKACILEAEGLAPADAPTEFGTVQADTAVFANNWSFDVTILTPGRVVIGWYTGLSVPPNGRVAAVGTVCGLGLDGESGVIYAHGTQQSPDDSIKPGHVHSADAKFYVGDIITAYADLDAGAIQYFRNGVIDEPIATYVVEDLSSVHQNGLIPAVSLARGQRVRVNFGRSPSICCMTSSSRDALGSPLCAPPLEMSVFHQLAYLTVCLERVTREVSEATRDTTQLVLIRDAIMAQICARMIADASSNTTSDSDCDVDHFKVNYYLRALLLPSLYRIASSADSRPMLDALVVGVGQHLQRYQSLVESFALSALAALADTCRSARLFSQTCNVDMDPCACGAAPAIKVAASLFRSRWMHQVLARYAQVNGKFNYDRYSELIIPLFTTKPPSPVDLEMLFPDVPLTSLTSVASVQNLAATHHGTGARVKWIQSVLSAISSSHSELVDSLGSDYSTGLFRQFVEEYATHIQTRAHHMLARDVLYRASLRNIVQALFSASVPDSGTLSERYPARFFLPEELAVGETPSRDAYDPGRLGGVASHLRKELAPPSRDALPALSRPQPVGGTVRSECDKEQGTDPALIDERELYFDRAMRMYTTGLAPSFKSATGAVSAFTEAAARLSKKVPDISSDLALGGKIFQVAKEELDAVKKAALNLLFTRIDVYDRRKQEILARVCGCLGEVLLRVGARTDNDAKSALFSYIPEVYLEVHIDSFHALRRADPPYQFSAHPFSKSIVDDVVSVLMRHFHDKRIVNADLRDLLLQSISVLLQYRPFVHVVQDNAVAQVEFMPALLRSFDNRFWIPITNILLRVWRGRGFDQAGVASDGRDPPSRHLQELFRRAAKGDRDLFTRFLNQLFNNLNWTMTELGVCVKEILAIIDGRSNINADQNRSVGELSRRSRKCNVVFELSASLLRVMEFIALDMPCTFLDHATDRGRLLEAMCSAVNMTVSTSAKDAGAFSRLAGLQLPALVKLSETQLLAPISGLIVALGHEACDDHPVASESFIRQLALHMAFDVDRFQRLSDFADEDNDGYSTLCTLLTSLKTKFDEGQDPRSPSSHAQELCTICYHHRADTEFVPCGHTSCNHCIERHLLNESTCFFCKTTIESTESIRE